MLKKLTAIFMTIAMTFGMAFVPAKASATYESRLTLDDTGWFGTNANNTNSALYLHGTDSYLDTSGEEWNGSDRILLPADTDSGLWVGSVRQENLDMKKFMGGNSTDFVGKHLYYIGGFTANAGDVLTIKGNFNTKDGKAALHFAESKFTWTGSAWVAYTEPVLPDEDNRSLTLDADTENGGNANGIYLLTDDGFAADETWTKNIVATDDEQSGIFLNGSKTNAFIKKYASGKSYLVLSDVGITAKDKDKIVIKGIFELDGYLVAYKETTLYYNGQVWVKTYIEPETVSYTDVALDSMLDVSMYREAEKRWDIYLSVKGKLPGKADEMRYSDIRVEVDGEEHLISAYHAAYEDSFFFVLEDSILPQKPSKNIKIVIKAGEYVSNDVLKGIRITKDYTLYANQYGISDDKFKTVVTPTKSNVKLSVDREVLYGGDGNGIFCLTEDEFEVDGSWQTSIRAVSYDSESGIFLNGTKIEAVLKKFQEGKVYIGIADAGVLAKDGDKLVIKGLFQCGNTAMSYAEHTFYYNGKTWNTSYFEQKEQWFDIKATGINKVTSYSEKDGRWNVYIDVEGTLPGEIDKFSFSGLQVLVNGKELENSTVYHSYEDTLYFPIYEQDLSKDAKTGIEITVKAGKAQGSDRTQGICLVEDFTFYTFLDSLTTEKPTTDTKYLEVSDISLFKTSPYHEEWGLWQVFVAVKETFTTAPETEFYKLPIDINGKTYYVKAIQSGTNLYFEVTKEMVDPDAKDAVLTIKKGAAAIGNAGRDGVRLNDSLKIYLFNRTWSEKQYKEVTMTDCNLSGVQDSTFVKNADGTAYTNVYVWTDTKMPGSPWYEAYLVPIYYNGEQKTVQMEKVVSTFGRLMYFGLTGIPKDGDIVSFKAGTKAVAGGLGFTIKNDYSLIYENGLWSEYVKSDVKKPADDKSLWDVARFDSTFIPYTDKGVVTFSNTDRYNVIKSIEPMKDYTISFTARKLEDNNESLPNFTLMLRANQIDEDTAISKTAMYGYIISMQYGQLSLFKNNENWEVIDTYRLSYEPPEKDEKFFEFGVDYEYEVSIYNVTDTCVCIRFSINGVEQIRYYDHASEDPLDPVVNEGEFRIYADCTTSISDEVATVDELIVSAQETETNKGIYVATSYPYVEEDSAFTVDGEGGTVENGIFRATKAGTYTISGTYKGNPVKEKTIVVSEQKKKQGSGEDDIIYEEVVVVNWPVVIALAAGVTLALSGVAVLIVKLRKHRKMEGN